MVELKQGDKVVARNVFPWEDGDVVGTIVDPGDGTETATAVVEGTDGVWLELEPTRLELVKS